LFRAFYKKVKISQNFCKFPHLKKDHKRKIVHIVKILLSVLLLICLFKMPYGYYQFVRCFAMSSFIFLAFDILKKDGRSALFFIYLFLALLFQPFIKIALGRFIWNLVDVAVALWLLFSLRKRTE